MAVLTSTGAVNLTSSTNWSPVQIPVDGDDLVIGAHTLTLDADLTLNSITFNNGSSRLAISGTTRVINVTNGFDVQGVNLSAQLITTAIPSGTSLTLRGQWKSTTTAGTIQGIASSTGGNLTLATIGDDPSAVLFAAPNTASATRVITSSWTGGTLTTIGKFDLSSWTASSTLVTISGGTWNHTHTGTSFIGNGTGLWRLLNQSSTATGSWTGDLEAASSIAANGLFQFAGSGNWTITGNILLTTSSASAGSYTGIVGYANATHTLTIVGKLCCRGKAVSINGQLGSGGRINWRNQSISISSADSVVIYMPGIGTLDVTDLIVTNAGKFIILVSAGSTTVVTGVNTLITNTTTAAQAVVYTAAGELDGKVINLSSDILRIPTADEVAADADPFGYSASPITPTGLVVDPAVIAAAVSSALDNISSTSTNKIADGVLTRNVSNVEATAGEHTLATTVLSMLEWEISGNDLIIKRTDGTTVHYTKTLSSATGTGDVITGLN